MKSKNKIVISIVLITTIQLFLFNFWMFTICDSISKGFNKVSKQDSIQTSTLWKICEQRLIRIDTVNTDIKRIINNHGMIIRSMFSNQGYDTTRHIEHYDREELIKVRDIENNEKLEYEKLKNKSKSKRRKK